MSILNFTVIVLMFLLSINVSETGLASTVNQSKLNDIEGDLKELSLQGLAWELRSDKQGVKVQTSNYPNSNFLAVKTSMKVDARLQDITNLVLLNDGCHEGSSTCESVSKVREISPQNYYQYVVSNFPWPLRNRDMLLHVQVRQDEQGNVIINGYSDPEKYALQEKLVRIKQMQVLWLLTPLNDGQVMIEHFIHSDPEGNIFSWVFNDAIDKVPLETFQNIRRLLEIPKYQNRSLSYINELND